MRVTKAILCAALLCRLCGAARPVIFDTDMGNDIDDALALAMLHALTDRGECELIGVTLTNAHPAAAPFTSMVNRFYGRPEIPVGAAMRTIQGGAQDGYLTAAMRDAPAQLRADGARSEPAITVLRRLLAGSREPVTIVQTGFSTNLAALLDSRADAISPLDGPALVRRKVALLVAMAGNFSGGPPEYNVRLDIAAARAVFERWPGPVVFSGFEIGRDLPYPAASVERDFAYAPWHPIAAAYRAYHRMPYDRPTWDLTAVLAAVRPNAGYFGLSAPGTVRVGDDGLTRFIASGGDRRFLLLEAALRARIVEALTLLASEPPKLAARR